MSYFRSFMKEKLHRICTQEAESASHHSRQQQADNATHQMHFAVISQNRTVSQDLQHCLADVNYRSVLCRRKIGNRGI